jgi:hypothetical protein
VCTIRKAALDKTVAEVTEPSTVWSAVESLTPQPDGVVVDALNAPARRSHPEGSMASASFDFASFQGESTASRIVLVGEIRILHSVDTFEQVPLDNSVMAHDFVDNVNESGAVKIAIGGPAK